MTTTNTTTGVTYGPQRYTVGTTGSWTLSVFADGVIECNCPDATIRRRACKHITGFDPKTAGKPRVRVSVRPARQRVISAETRELLTSLDV